MPGNAGGAKGPDFWHASEDGEVKVIGDMPTNTDYDPDPSVEALTARRRLLRTEMSSHDISSAGRPPRALRRSQSESRVRETRTHGLMSGDGKRGAGHRPQATAPILDSTIASEVRPAMTASP
jgi:hypothetical protein